MYFVNMLLPPYICAPVMRRAIMATLSSALPSKLFRCYSDPEPRSENAYAQARPRREACSAGNHFDHREH